MRHQIPLRLLLIAMTAFFLSKETVAQKKFTATKISNQSAGNLRSHFQDYSLFSINTREIADFSKAQKDRKIDFDLELPGLANWKLAIAEHDILSKDYTLTVDGPGGRISYPRPACMSYAGNLSDKAGSRVSLTITDDLLYGCVRNGEEEYFIEPASYFNKAASPDLFVVYNTRNVKTDPGLTCGVTERSQRMFGNLRLNAGANCVRTELAIASDESMFLRYGSAAAVQAHNIGVINNVIWDYVNAQFDDNIEFFIVTQNVSTSAATDQLSPAYTGTNSGTILDNFGNWAQAGNFSATYDLGEFWTTRNIDNDGAGGGSGTVGLAWVGAVCSVVRYHILEDFAGSNPSGSGYLLRVLTSHEIGHNFGCNHDGSAGFIMSPSVGNTSTWSAASITDVNAMVPGYGCLSACSLAGTPLADFIITPEVVCSGGTFQLIDHSLRGPSSWSWTMTGGTPASSTLRNPTVSYASSGVKSISLTPTNGGGSGAPFVKQVLVSAAPSAACTNTGASASDAGLKYFSLANINKTTGGSSTDGNKYMDFSCSDVTRLYADSTYTVTVNVGTTVPSNQFNLVQFFIDYNNDGDFGDAGEVVYSSGSGYIGITSFSFSTPASPPVQNQFLRARLIAKDFVGGTDPCYNVTNGQVEDYSVFFMSGFTLPVSFLYFDGYRQNGKNILNWETANEKDNSYFVVERSFNATDFEAIGQVSGANTTNTSSRYGFTDLLDGAGNQDRIFYRLRIVSLSGASEYSKVITLSSKPENTGLLLSLQPNPFINAFSFTFRLSSANNVHVQLMDMTGRTVYRNEQRFTAGIHSYTSPDLDKLPRGTYLLKIVTNNGTTSRLVEKR